MMRRIAAAILAAAVFLLLPACTQEAESGDSTVQVYRLLQDTEQSHGELIAPETLSVPSDTYLLHFLLSAFASEPADSALTSAMPAGVEFLSYTLEEDGALILNLSASYRDLPPIEKTLVNGCLTLTFTALDEVESVSVYAEDHPEILGLTADDILIYDQAINPYEQQIRLYFADADGHFLDSEVHTLSVGEEALSERVVMEELLRGPYSSSLYSPIPAGTELLSISTEDGLCTVDLSADFLANKPNTAIEERLVLYTIVNTLTNLPDTQYVQILVEGSPVDTYVYRDLSEPLSRNDLVLGPPNSARGEEEVLVYLALEGGRLAAIPRIVERDEALSPELTTLLALLDAKSEPGYVSLFEGSEGVISVETRSRICYLDLTTDFFAYCSSKEQIALAVEAITASLTQLENVDAVHLTLDGEEAIIGDMDFSGELTADPSVIVP